MNFGVLIWTMTWEFIVFHGFLRGIPRQMVAMEGGRKKLTDGRLLMSFGMDIYTRIYRDTVDGRNPTPVDRQPIPLFTRFYTSQVVIAGFLPTVSKVDQLMEGVKY